MRSESERVVTLNEKQKSMKPKQLSLAIAALFAAGGLWFALSALRTQPLAKPSMAAGNQTPDSTDGQSFRPPNGPPKPGQMLRPPDPSRRFRDFTPEQRVDFARRGHGPGG
jgi:hypothetical protein